MKRIIGWLAFSVGVLSTMAALAASETRDFTRSDIVADQRIALVTGNQNYQKGGTLSNPTNDAKDVAAALERLGFTVMLRLDRTAREMVEDIEDFGAKLSTKGTALYFYAGHAMQFQGRNYLLPVDAAIKREGAVEFEGVDTARVLGEMEAKGTAVNFVVLDACRNNPFTRSFRSASQGLASTTTPDGTLVVYATKAGKVAEDGTGRNGTFTKYFLKHVSTPGLDAQSMLRRVRVDVLAETRKTQYPVEDGGLTADFYFAPASPVSTPSKPIAPAQQLAMLDRAYLTIDAEPRNAQIRIVNIGSPYRAGMELAPGDYEVEVTAEGYEPHYALYRVDSGNRSIAVQLKAKPKGRQAGEVFRDKLRDGSEGPEMVVIPAGSFEMGSNDGDDDEKPVHRVTLTRPFALGSTEITFADYDRFAQATSREKPGDEAWGRGSRPVINVSWNDAVAYAQWLSEQTGKRYRLPSEAEWEYAARAGSGKKYWWGEKIGRNNANCNGCGSQWDFQQTAPVKSFKRNDFDLYDTAGNVWEWTADCWNENYRGAPADGSAWTRGDCGRRVVRGGSWGSGPAWVRSAYRNRNDTANRNFSYGFRLAQDI